MSATRFIRTTHQNGQFRSFLPEAIQFWGEHGAKVGVITPRMRPNLCGTRGRVSEAHPTTDFSSDSFTTRRNLSGLEFGYMARMGVVLIAGYRGREKHPVWDMRPRRGYWRL